MKNRVNYTLFDFLEMQGALHRNFNLCIFPEKELHGLSPNFPIHVSMRNLYIPTFGPPIVLQQNRQTDQGYINRSQKHECRNRDCSRAVPFLGLFVSNFLYCVFAVCHDEKFSAKICFVEK
jgi:hypothetical protein